jgi:dipeptidyl aminopeptidase/acylaminoacyl peptidase
VSGGRAACALTVIASACYTPPARPAPPPAVRIVATERGPTGGRLVVIDEAGLRTAELVPPAAETARDNSAVFSPDGAWIAFASSRGRGENLEHTSLWVVAAKLDATPMRITDDRGDDLEPAWTPDGKALVFASDRGGSFDLWRVTLAIAGDRVSASSRPVQLTSEPGLELAPSVGPDGRIAFAAIERDGQGTMESRIEILDEAGVGHAVTDGPGDGTPAWSPDGKTIAFSAPMAREGGAVDADVLAVDADGGHRRVLLESPGTDESGPVWSHDGRWLFATSLARKAQGGKPLLSSIVYADLRATPPVARMLRDPAAALSRLAPAVAPVALDDKALAAGPLYGEALEQILIHALERQQDQQP